jgi:Ser/Thr protein kinase RdoA (MazF antagonist)
MHDSLTQLLRFYPASVQPLATPLWLGNAGGGSGARLWRFESGIGDLVARAWPIDGPGPAVLGRIQTWLARLADLDFVPVPLNALDGRTLVLLDGQHWEITPWRPGKADGGRPPDPIRLRAAFSGLAAVHQRLAFESVEALSPGLQTRLMEAEELLSTGLNRLERAIGQTPNNPATQPAVRWLTLARDGLPGVVERLRRSVPIPLMLQPTLRDARAEHFLFEGDRLTGLVDFGAMGVDSTASDLARLLTDWVGNDREAFAIALDAYAAIRPLESLEIERIETFAESAAWLGPAHWLRWHFLDRRPFDDPDAVRKGLERGLERLIERIASRPITS